MVMGRFILPYSREVIDGVENSEMALTTMKL